MTLGKLSIMKQSVIIYKIYKQDLVVWNRMSCSTNALSIARETIASLLENPLDKLLCILIVNLVGTGVLSRPSFSKFRPVLKSGLHMLFISSWHIIQNKL